MKLHAGSLHKNWLVLYGENITPICIQVNDSDTQWDIYCNDVEIGLLTTKTAEIIFNGQRFVLPYIQTDNPMKTLGLGEIK